MNAAIKITLHKRLPIVWLIFLAITAVLLPGRIWSILLIGFGGMVIVAFIWVRLLAHQLSGSRKLRFGWVAVGDRLSEQFEIRNVGSLPALWVELSDNSNVPGYQPAVVRSIAANNIDRWRQSAICRQRGRYQLGPWTLQSADPFGIFRVTISYPSSEEIVIHPPIHEQIPVSLPAGQSSGQIRSSSRRQQATINASTIRNYQPQDPLHWIHWPTSAHRDDLFVRQFDVDAAGDVWLVLDLQSAAQIGQGIDGTEEQAVLLAATLAARGLNQNRAIGLASYGQQPQVIPPARGKHQQWKLLQALALVAADGENTLDQALRDLGRIAQRGSAALIITPAAYGEWTPELLNLAQRGIRTKVALFHRGSFGEDSPTDTSQGLGDAIHHLGIECQLVRRGDLGRAAVETERRGFWEFKVTGTGRVVTVRTPFQS